MNKITPYISLGIILTGLVLLVASEKKSSKLFFDNRVTLNRNQKIPYGTWVAFHSLPHLFPEATLQINRMQLEKCKWLDEDSSGQVFFILTKKFNAGIDEMNRLINWVRRGNDVFISAFHFSEEAKKIFRIDEKYSFGVVEFLDIHNPEDSLTLSLQYPEKKKYIYPGKKLENVFTKTDELISSVLGYSSSDMPNFISLKAGAGHVYVHLSPMAFTNYFILHKKNLEYYEKIMSLFQPAPRKIIWDEYFLNAPKANSRRRNSGSLTVLFRFPGLKAAFFSALLGLLLYLLMEARRRQRYIPVIQKPRNDSLEFVKTIGRLYFERGDHRNLAHKMITYFLEHVRNRYKISTGQLDDEFIKKLHFKSGVGEEEIRNIVNQINAVSDSTQFTADHLFSLYKSIQEFYKKTF
ncbi:MAG: hypothetical protein N2747_02285 [Chitinophagaceae bacterium]|nr:hypothetical protein [Chitinophagaceae bacterium]